MKDIELKKKCKKYTELLEIEMHKRLNSDNELNEAMKYSVFAGGKRLRPLLMFALSEVFDLKIEKIMPYAVAIEFIHTYSLIHDDLPSMDNDDLRRGKPTNHIIYGEDMAILAGDGLLNLSMEILLDNLDEDFDKKNLTATKKLFQSSGILGMVLGQSIDIKNENLSISLEDLKEINDLKTGKLIKASIIIPSILAGLDEKTIALLGDMANNLGLAYQIKDDLLDINGENIGKPTGSDERNCKNTYPSILGIEKTEKHYENLSNLIKGYIKNICKEEDFFYLLLDNILSREV